MLYSSLPHTIKIGEDKLTPYLGHLNAKQVILTCRAKGAKFRKVKVLPAALRGRIDMHGKPYAATEWIFTNLPTTN